VGRGAWGVGRGAWGVGRGAWGVGRGAWGVGHSGGPPLPRPPLRVPWLLLVTAGEASTATHLDPRAVADLALRAAAAHRAPIWRPGLTTRVVSVLWALSRHPSHRRALRPLVPTMLSLTRATPEVWREQMILPGLAFLRNMGKDVGCVTDDLCTVGGWGAVRLATPACSPSVADPCARPAAH
jgi:hypothetical protein